MKLKKRTRLLSLFLTLVMIASIIPMNLFIDVKAITTESVESRIISLCKKLGISNPNLYSGVTQKGIYFTTDKKKATTDSDSRTYNYSVANADWFVSSFGSGVGSNSFTSGHTCNGFAKFAQWYIFSGNPNKNVPVSWSGNKALNKENAKQCILGDRLSFNKASKTDCHQAIFLGYNNTGYIVLDSNFVVNPSNIVAIHTISYGAYASFDCGRANNYSPTSNNTTITSSTDLRSSILKIAAGELGNTNGSKYGSGAWCAHFVSWCARQAGVEKNVIANSGYATADDLGVLYFGRKIVNGKRTEIDYSQYVPQKGDLIFFDWENNGICMKTPESFYGDHVGFVESFDLNKKEVKTIEGNSSNAVRRKTYSINDVNIKGYGIPSYPSDSLNGKVSDNISITLLNASVPSKVKQGDAAYFKGTISANSPIRIAGIAIYDSNSNMVSYASKTIYPNTNSVSIDSQIDPSIHISQLPSGTYTYMIFASCMQSIFDILKTTKILKKGTFVVSSANSTVMAGVSLVSLIEKAYVSPSTTTKTDSSSKNSKTYKVGNYTVDTSAGLNVRKGPSTDYQIVKALKDGTKVKITEISGVWGKYADGWINLEYADYVSALEPEIKKPGTVSSLTLKTAADIPVKGIATVKWNAASDADYYYVSLKDSSGKTVKKIDKVKGKDASFTLTSAGTYSISVIAKNSKYSGSEVTLSQKITAHNPSTVQFVDYDGKVISKQTITYGSNAVVPEAPSRYGFTFKNWSGTYTNVKSNQTVTATYTRNKYTVKFYDENGTLLKTQSVSYESAATAPSYTPNDGYNFVSWDKPFNYITGNLSVSAVAQWYDNDMKVAIGSVAAVRDADGNGIDVTYTLSNRKNEITAARAVVAIKTSEGKLVTSTESAAFSIKNNVTKSQEVYVPLPEDFNGAYSAEIYIIENYKTPIPISASQRVVIDQGAGNWSAWSTTRPTGIADEYIQSRTEYRYRDKKTTTSSSSSLSGWTKYDTTWAWSSYGSWSSWTDTKVTASDSREVQTQQVAKTYKTQYKYYHYSLPKKNGETATCAVGKAGYNRTTGISPATSETYHTTAWLDSPLTKSSVFAWYANGTATKTTDYQSYTGKKCCNTVSGGTDRWFLLSTQKVAATYKTQYRYRDRSKVYTYHFWQWGSWSSWGTTKYTATDNRAVETRTTYRYRSNDVVGFEDNSGLERTISGNVGSEFAGKDAILVIYKVDEASDYSNQYVEQLKIGSDGSYSASFKLLSEPSVASGDYTVALGIVGTKSVIYLDPIEAPKPQYTVTFYDDTENGNIISQQTVTEGENAEIPESPEKEGYRFIYWDSTATNVKDNLDVYAHYEKLTYDVVFVDWSEESIEIQTYEHGQPLAPPEFIEPEDSTMVCWNGVTDDMPVTENMVIVAEYETKQFSVTFMDWNNNVISQQTVEYGQAAELPETLSAQDYVFFDWNSDSNIEYVTEDAIVVPSYAFEETAETPVISIENGDYDTAQTVSITCATPNADIYYTLDGSDPSYDSAIKYTGAFTLDHGCQIRAIASAFHMNDSSEDSRVVAINTGSVTNDLYSYDELPEFVLNDLVNYRLYPNMGYRYKETREAETLGEQSSYIALGWTLDDIYYSDYSEWSRDYPDVSNLIEPEIEETDPEPEATVLHNYSRWVYNENGTEKYSYEEIPGTDGEWKTLKVRDQLPISAFESGNMVFSYNGEKWYNWTTSNEYVVPDYKVYRYRSVIETYSIWTGWTASAPSASEEREYESGMVYSFSSPVQHVVTLIDENTDEPIVFLNIDGQKLSYNTEDFEMEGYTFTNAYTDAECTTVWNIEQNTVTEPLTLYIKWTPKTYTVTFIGFNGQVVDAQTVSFLDYAEMPEFEEVDGYIFCGTDAESLIVTEDMTVTANYVREEDYVKLSLDKSSYAMYTGTSFVLNATVTPEAAENKDVYWVSSDENIAVVDDEGKVTGVGEGTATIYAICDETGYGEQCEVTVNKNVNESIILSQNATCSTDAVGQLRGIKADGNTVTEIKEKFVNQTLVFIDINGNELEADDLVGTGTVIRLVSGENILDEMTVVITGDINGDGKINNRDVAMGTRYLVEKESFALCQVTAFDTNGDGKANNRDAAMLSRYLVGKETI